MTTAPSSPPAVLADPPGAAPPDLETVLAGLLAGVLRVDRVAAESHFFDDLGADSLVMAHFCARVRKNGNLPPVSMRDVYRHPTIGRLAAALADARPARAGGPDPPPPAAPTPTGTREYILCGALQIFFFLVYSSIAVLAIVQGYRWISAAPDAAGIYLRSVLAGSAIFTAASALPVLAKWVLVGRWTPRQIRLWSPGYVRFWIVRVLVRSSPVPRLFVGTSIYALYLRSLGARIGPGAVILSRRVPLCTDLLSIGAGSVIRREVLLNGYRAVAGRIETGAVTIGRDAFVGERSVLDIGTSMGDGAQLGHASALHGGQSVPAGERWHGSPAQPTNVNYLRVPPARCGALRRAAYSAALLSAVLLLVIPLLQAGTSLAIGAASAQVRVLDPGGTGLRSLVLEAGLLSLGLFWGVVIAGLLVVIAVSRLASSWIRPDTVYPLYGFRDAVHRAVGRVGRTRFFTYLFGDSSYIVHYLQWLGYRLSPVVQTGSNFGIEVMHANPSLSAVGSGTMAADGLVLMNDDVSGTSFRVSRAAIGPRNFIGNDVTYPAGGRTGDNVLLGTKAMVPLDGALREGVGLLGSPPFEIPRSVERDTRFDHHREREAMRRGLAAKTRYNLRTIGVFILTRWGGFFIYAALYLAAIEFYDDVPLAASALYLSLSLVVTAVYFALVQRGVAALHPVKPVICSIYHIDFWSVERLWKVHPIGYFSAFDGTPFKPMLWRLMGARIGRRVFDDGAHISEPTLTAVGDESVLNHRSKIQCHSQEDGTFKCDHTAIGVRCTVGVGAFVHYGVTMGDGSALAADSFLMKGEDVPPGAQWGGNPAREM